MLKIYLLESHVSELPILISVRILLILKPKTQKALHLKVRKFFQDSEHLQNISSAYPRKEDQVLN